MKKRHWLKITLITLAACTVAGIILAVILFNANGGRTGASSSVQFSFEGAAEGLAPNSYRYDLNGFQKDEVLEAALKDVGLEGKYNANQLRENLIVSGVYPKNIVERMTNYESLLTGDAGRVSAGDYHATLYSVTLYNDFDKGISQADLEKLLGAIMEEYRADFERTYSIFLAEDTMVTDLSGYDYAQQLEILNNSVNRKLGYAREMAEDHPDFLVNGEGFADIAVRYAGLQSMDLERLGSIVTMNALSKNPDRIAAQYENREKNLKIRIQELQAEAKDLETLISQYSKDDIIYISTSDALQKVDSNSSDTYDTLITHRQEIADSIADLEKELVQVQLKITDLGGGEKEEATETSETEKNETAETPKASVDEDREPQKAVVENGITTAKAKLDQVTEDFTSLLKAYSEKEMNDSTVALTEVKYNTPKYLSGAFIKQVIKAAGPICVLGLVVCLVVMIVSRRKEEKAQRK